MNKERRSENHGGKTEWGAEKGKNYYILKVCDIEPKAEKEDE